MIWPVDSNRFAARVNVDLNIYLRSGILLHVEPCKAASCMDIGLRRGFRLIRLFLFSAEACFVYSSIHNVPFFLLHD